MWRVRLTLAGAAVIATLAAGAPWAPASPDATTLRLTAGSDELGWISLTVRGPDRGAVVVREVTGGRTARVARLSLRDGTAARPHAVRWRCGQRSRRFVATTGGAGTQAATAAIVTPSCADRLRMIVVPARVRPGQVASVRVTDTWRFGGVTAKVCARRGPGDASCKLVRLAPGVATQRTRLRLERLGPRTIVLRSPFGQRLSAAVEVREDARLQVLVTGDSMILGLFESLAGDLGPLGAVLGDPHPGRGITTPGFLDWPAHARRSAHTARPDVTVVFLGSADAGYPLSSPAGVVAPCCDAPWVTEYARRVSTMMAAWLRDGRGLVYWVLLPAPRSIAKAKVAGAENAAVRLAGAGFEDGVDVIERVADVISPGGRYQDTIAVDGRVEVVRDDDGVHLAPLGIRIATDILHEALRGDGLLP